MRAAALMMGCVLLAGCPDAGLLRTAASADRAAFGRELQAHVAAAAIDLEQARAIAWRRASYEIGNAKGDDGARGVTSVRGCAKALRRPLLQRAQSSDEVAASAAMIAIDAGLVQPLAYAHKVTSSEAHWRAVGARSLQRAGVLPAVGPAASGAPAKAASLPAGVDAASPEAVSLARAGWWRRKLMADADQMVRRG